MSCGKPHEVPCTEVLDKVYAFIDGELPAEERTWVRQHLEECGPCLEEFGIEEHVKSIVRRACSDPAPDELRRKVLLRIDEVRVTITEQ